MKAKITTKSEKMILKIEHFNISNVENAKKFDEILLKF